MSAYKKTVATAKAKVADAEVQAFMARLEAVDAILEGASPRDVLMVCAHALADAVPLCCEAHQDEFKADFLRALSDCIEMEEQNAAEADGDDDAHPQVH